MPLDRGCSKDSVEANYRQLYKDGYRNPQLSAIVLSVLKRSCGVKSKDQMSAGEIIGSSKSKTEARKKPLQLQKRRKSEGRWVELSGLFEDLPSSPVVRGLSFNLPGGMRGVGTSPSSSPPDDSRGLLGGVAPPIPLTKCEGCGVVYNKAIGKCPKCRGREP